MTPAEADAPPAARLKEAGAILFAKTTMPDYGMLSSGLSSHHPLARNPVEARPQSRRIVGGGGGGGRGALRAAACRHRHRRLGPAAGRLVRDRRPEAERGARADRSALCRPRRRPDDPQRRRRGAHDGDADAAGRARLSRASNTRRSTGRSGRRRLAGLRVGLMMEAGCGDPCGPETRAAVERAARDFEAAGARVEPLAPFLTQDDARRARPFLAHAGADRP